MEVVAIVALVAFVLWIFSGFGPWSKKQVAAPRQEEAKSRQTEAIDLSVLKVPADLEEAICRALRDETDPDSVPLPSGFHAHDLRVVGESFPNPNGSSRQDIIGRAHLGEVAYLVPEPRNPHDPEAVRVYLADPSGVAQQIGYLPRGYSDIVDEVRKGRVAAWLKSKQRADNSLWGATLYLLRKEGWTTD